MNTSISNSCLSEDGCQPGWGQVSLVCQGSGVPCGPILMLTAKWSHRVIAFCFLREWVGSPSLQSPLWFQGRGSGLYLFISRACCRVLYRTLAVKVQNDHNEGLSTWLGWELLLFISLYTLISLSPCLLNICSEDFVSQNILKLIQI